MSVRVCWENECDLCILERISVDVCFEEDEYRCVVGLSVGVCV